MQELLVQFTGNLFLYKTCINVNERSLIMEYMQTRVTVSQLVRTFTWRPFQINAAAIERTDET